MTSETGPERKPEKDTEKRKTCSNVTINQRGVISQIRMYIVCRYCVALLQLCPFVYHKSIMGLLKLMLRFQVYEYFVCIFRM